MKHIFEIEAIIITIIFAFPTFAQTQDSLLNQAKQNKDSILPVQEITLKSLPKSTRLVSPSIKNSIDINQNGSDLFGNYYIYKAGSCIKSSIFLSFAASGMFIVAGLIQPQNHNSVFAFMFDVGGIVCSIGAIGSLWRAGDNLQKASGH
jgi:hypothetical protein